MINWIQRYFQRHFRAIFAVMLFIMVVPLIWVFNPSSGTRGADRNIVERRAFGYNLNSPEDSRRLFGDAALSVQMQAGYSPDSSQIESYAFQRAALLQLADELHIPPPTKQEVSDFIKTLRMFSGQDGQFSPQAYTAFRDSLKTNSGLHEADVSRVLADDVRSGKVQRIIGGPGYVLMSDVKAQIEQSDTSWTVGLATVDYASFNPNIPVVDATIASYFEENAARYEIPPRVEVSYADFSAIPLLPSISVTDAEVRAYYDENPARFPKPPAADPKAAPKADPAADFAAVRPQVETALKLDRARRAAAKTASDFSFALYQAKATPGTPAFDAVLKTYNVTMKSLAPFTQDAGPAELGGSHEIAAEAFKLNKDRVVSDAVTSPSGAVVLFWKDLQPARKPLLNEVRAKVVADYVDGEKRKRFVELGRTVRAAIETRLKAGDSFEKAVAAAASANNAKIDAKLLPAFTTRQPPQELDYNVYNALTRLEKGHVSDMIVARDHGLLVFAADKKLPTISESSPEFSATRAQLAMTSSRVAANSYISDLITTELKKSEPNPAKP
jgi:peptidyl-prolyl cis-trans isomerase D